MGDGSHKIGLSKFKGSINFKNNIGSNCKFKKWPSKTLNMQHLMYGETKFQNYILQHNKANDTHQPTTEK
jgi:hypothetical protein